MANKKAQRLTDRLNIALARASAAVAVGKSNPKLAQKCCENADTALAEAQAIMGEIMRAAEAI